MAFGIQKMGRRVAVRMNDQAFNRKDQILAIAFLTKFKRVCNFFRIQTGDAVWLIQQFMNGRALVAIDMWLNWSSNDITGSYGSITPYCKVVDHLLIRYGTGTVTAKVNEEIQKLNNAHVRCEMFPDFI